MGKKKRKNKHVKNKHVNDNPFIMKEPPYRANPACYADKNGNAFCAFALTEDVTTILPAAPSYAVNGQMISNYCITLISLSSFGSYGIYPFDDAMEKLDKYIISRRKGEVIVRGLKNYEMANLAESLAEKRIEF